jgi:hypothetical protein
MTMHSLSWYGVTAHYFQSKLRPGGVSLGIAPLLATALTVLVLGVRPCVAQETSPVSFRTNFRTRHVRYLWSR